MASMRTIVIIAFMALVLLVTLVLADKKADMKQACDMCGNINQGGGAKKSNYVCPKETVKDCNININGWCCGKKRENSRCKPCWNLDEEDDDDDEI